LHDVFVGGRTRDPSWRIEQLRGIERLCDEREQEIAEALAQDLGRPAFDSWLADVAPTKAEAAYARKHLSAADATRERFFGWALGMAREAESAVVGPDQAQWLARLDIHALIVGEFEDYGLLREFARAGHGLIPVPALQVDYFTELYGLKPIGIAEGVSVQFYALSIERKIKHPAVAAIVQSARQIFASGAGWGKRGKSAKR